MTTSRSSRPWRRLRSRILARDGGVCHYCGDPAVEVDHVIPRARGGGDSPENLVAACRACNRSKGSRLVVPGRKGPFLSAATSGHSSPRPLSPQRSSTGISHHNRDRLRVDLGERGPLG